MSNRVALLAQAVVKGLQIRGRVYKKDMALVVLTGVEITVVLLKVMEVVLTKECRVLVLVLVQWHQSDTRSLHVITQPLLVSCAHLQKFPPQLQHHLRQ